MEARTPRIDTSCFPKPCWRNCGSTIGRTQTVDCTFRPFTADPKHKLCGRLGFTGVPHTRDQKLNPHCRPHCSIPAGALGTDGSRRVAADRKFPFPVKALSRVFRGKFMEALKNLYLEEKLVLEGTVEELVPRKAFNRLVDSLYRKEWLAYPKQPFKSPEFVPDYLERYTRRVAVSNDSILDFRDGSVGFAYRNRDEGYSTEIGTIPAETFITRFLFHELPGGFFGIRHIGFLRNRPKKACLEHIGEYPDVPKPEDLPTLALIVEPPGVDIGLCPVRKKARLIR
ncbi:MAG: hypothetical protein GY866_29085 [Proteobacteria bacterium]|nr:hypothetical protein [Pseudomonadota bacterium]